MDVHFIYMSIHFNALKCMYMVQKCIMMYTSGILYTWYMAVQGSLYWYIPVRTLLATWRYEKPQNGTVTYQYVLT